MELLKEANNPDPACQIPSSPRIREDGKGALPTVPPLPGLLAGPGDELRALPAGAASRLRSRPLAAEGALPPWAGTCRVPALGGLPGRPGIRTDSHHQLQECKRRRARGPGELQESSDTYSFPTASASQRGDVTGPHAGRSGRGATAARPTAPPPERRREGLLFPQDPAPSPRGPGAGAHGLRGRRRAGPTGRTPGAGLLERAAL